MTDAITAKLALRFAWCRVVAAATAVSLIPEGRQVRAVGELLALAREPR